jgi:Tfp pilus assembly protein PilE
VLVTASIIGILAATALPLYQRAVERGYWRSAQDILRVIHAGEQTHLMANNGYTAVAGLQDWRRIYMDSPNVATATLPVTFVVTTPPVPDPQTFTATATRIGNAGCVMSISQDGTLTPPTIDALPSGCIP